MRLGAIQFNVTNNFRTWTPVGVYLERVDGLGLDSRFLDSVTNGADPENGWKGYIRRFTGSWGLTLMNSFWQSAGAYLEWSEADSMEGRDIPDVTFLTPREWLVFQENGYSGFDIRFFQAKSSDTVDGVFDQVVAGNGQLSGRDGNKILDELPTYISRGWRPGMPTNFPVRPSEQQFVDTLKVMRDGVAGYVFGLDNKLERELRVGDGQSDS